MRHFPSVCSALLVLLLVGTASAAGTPLPRNTSRYDFAALSTRLETFITNGTVPGMTFVIVKDGEIVYEKAFGSYTLATTLPIASATKMPTSLAVMKLVDSGALKLEDKVSQYLPYWPQDKAEMKIWHLLSNTSGFSNDSAVTSDESISMDAAAQQIAQMPLLFPPGTQFCYNPNGFHIAGRIAEVLTGKSFVTHFNDTLFNPLGMQVFNYNSAANPWVAGGSQSNVEDYAKMLVLHLNQGWWPAGRLYQPETIAVMQQDHQGDKPVFSSPAPHWRYGLSWWLTTPPAGEPVTEISDQGAFGATPWLDLKRNYGAFILIRKTTPTGTLIWNAARPIINGLLDAANEPPALRLHPQGAAVNKGDPVALYALGAGRGPLAYQWQKNGVDIPGATQSWLRIKSAATADGGAYRVVVSNALGSTASNVAVVSLPNSPPVIQSHASAAPNPATAGEAVVFSMAAMDPDGDAMTVAWSFSDGLQKNGATGSRVFPAVGTYSASATVSDGRGGVSTTTMSIVVLAPNGAGGGATPLDPAGDADGDGVSNGDELSAGSDPNDRQSFPKLPLSVSKLQGSVRFDVSGKDACTFSGVLPNIPPGFSPAKLTLRASVGGVETSFLLDAHGKARSAAGSVSLKLKTVRGPKGAKTFSGGDVPFQIKLQSGSWTDEWADEGVLATEESVAKPVVIEVLIFFDGKAYGAAVDAVYSSKLGKLGRFKK